MLVLGGLRAVVTPFGDLECSSLCLKEKLFVNSRTVAVRSCAAALMVLLAGCAIFTDPSDGPRVSLVLRETDEVGIIGPRAEVQARSIVLRGIFWAPCLDNAVKAGATQSRGTVKVTLRGGRLLGDLCQTAIGPFPYTATVSGVGSGTYRVIVEHFIGDASLPRETVVDTTLRIP